MTASLIEERQHHLVIDVPNELRVTGDPARLAQVFSNLLSNAAKYAAAAAASPCPRRVSK